MKIKTHMKKLAALALAVMTAGSVMAADTVKVGIPPLFKRHDGHQ